jgi:hypothetical protein
MCIVSVYTRHLIKNWKVAFKAFLLFLFHFIHGIIPVKYTSHEYFGLKLTKD